MAAALESFYKPELAAHNPRPQASRSSPADGVLIPFTRVKRRIQDRAMPSLDSFKCRKTLTVGGKSYVYYSLPTAEKNGLKGISKLPYSMKVVLENLLRNEDDRTVKKDDILAVSRWLRKRKLEHEVAFRPARVLMQDFTGVPAVVDLAAMRNAMQALGGDADKINPLVPV